MILRYSHPLVTRLWSPVWQYETWRDIESAVLYAQAHVGVLPKPIAMSLGAQVAQIDISHHDVEDILLVERNTRHDVAAFLTWLRTKVDPGQFIHFGLTSSDVVDTALGIRFQALHRPLLSALGDVTSAISRFMLIDDPVAGRTHGEPAEPTSMRARAHGWLSLVELPILHLCDTNRRMAVCKMSGPVGNFAHNPPAVEAFVAGHFNLSPMGPGATQIVPRSTLAMWANNAAVLLGVLAKIAMDLRFMFQAGEIRWDRPSGHVGSSAMPHKNNPAEAEQISGLARLAAGYAQQLQPMALWLERDISNSSVERVAVPDLWHILLYTAERMASLLDRAEFRPLAASHNIDLDRYDLWSHKRTLDFLLDGVSYDRARKMALDLEGYPVDYNFDEKWFTANYPVGRS